MIWHIVSVRFIIGIHPDKCNIEVLTDGLVLVCAIVHGSCNTSVPLFVLFVYIICVVTDM